MAIPSAAAVDTEHADDGFVAPASYRHPDDALGPRARDTSRRIVDAARVAFRTGDYTATTIDEIARLAKVSRASVYTYFPSKREILFAVGARGAEELTAIIASLGERPGARAGIGTFVGDYFDFLDTGGGFSLTWSLAAREDEEVRVTGMKQHLKLCRMFGTALATWARRDVEEPTLLGMAAWSLLEGNWRYAQLYSDRLDRDAVVDEVARALWAMARAHR